MVPSSLQTVCVLCAKNTILIAEDEGVAICVAEVVAVAVIDGELISGEECSVAKALKMVRPSLRIILLEERERLSEVPDGIDAVVPLCATGTTSQKDRGIAQSRTGKIQSSRLRFRHSRYGPSTFFAPNFRTSHTTSDLKPDCRQNLINFRIAGKPDRNAKAVPHWYHASLFPRSKPENFGQAA